MARSHTSPPHDEEDRKAAYGGHGGVGAETYGALAGKLLDTGYEPVPILPGAKRPAVNRWSTVTVDGRQVDAWSAAYPDCGVGLRTGQLVGVDIDVLDDDLAWQVCDLTCRRLGDTLVRVGLWPKRMLLYRTERPFAKMTLGRIEILGAGQQFVAFGRHPGTGRRYEWPGGESPLDVPLVDLPRVDEAQVQELLGEMASILPRGVSDGPRTRPGTRGLSGGPVRDHTGRVIDGRDDWLSRLAYHEVHDAIERDEPAYSERLTERVWARFEATTDLERPRQDRRAPWGPAHARKKVEDKLRLHATGRLPSRRLPKVEAEYTAPDRTTVEARAHLDSLLVRFCADVARWSAEGRAGSLPMVGIRATVGLGKSSAARRHLKDLRERLETSGAPSRLLWFTPSHTLAEETAAAWRALGVTSAVLRGYERHDPLTGQPMCRDIPAISAALAGRLDPQTTVCMGQDGRHCRFWHGCLKQENRRVVRDAEVVIAPYDVLFTGLPVEPGEIALVVVDEGCWSRALRKLPGIAVETLGRQSAVDLGTGLTRNRAAGRAADRASFGNRLRQVLLSNGPGPLQRTAVTRHDLSVEMCRDAADFERRSLQDPGLVPGLTGRARDRAIAAAREVELTHRRVDLWRSVGDLVASGRASDGRVKVEPQPDGTHHAHVTGLARVHHNLAHLPVLHLDATLRPEIATRILPGLVVHEVDATAPDMWVRLVAGGFGKSALLGKAGPNRLLQDCVDYVRWQARRLAQKRVLVVTHKHCEAAFADLPGIVTLHFNALAGLDSFGDVAAIIIVGRPLPSEIALHPFCAAFAAEVPSGGYQGERTAVRMRDGSSRPVRAIRHTSETAEQFRAAICDDELVQAIGRGRGVNRSPDTRLEVHLLADVALPLVHDQVIAWDTVAPDILQRMLLDGVAVDSPADAAALHPQLLANEKQAQKAFERAGFKRHLPMSTYRGMSLKSAAYRRGGRGRSWQTVLWPADLDEAAARHALEAVLGPLDWRRS